MTTHSLLAFQHGFNTFWISGIRLMCCSALHLCISAHLLGSDASNVANISLFFSLQMWKLFPQSVIVLKQVVTSYVTSLISK